MAAIDKRPKLRNLRAQGVQLGAVDLPEEFKNWLLEQGLLTAEAVYGYFYIHTHEKEALLNNFGFNRQRLYDRLCKVIPSETIARLNALAAEQYELGEA